MGAAIFREAGSGEEGLNQMDTFAPQLIFMDFYLPDIGALDLARKIKTAYPEIIVAIFSSLNSPEYQTAATECGV